MKARLTSAAKRAWLPAAIVLLYLYNFPYFEAIHSANELPRIYLTMAIVDRGALNIDPEFRRFQFTPDTSSYKGKLYANKAPGMSFLTVPVYWVQKQANGGRTPTLPRMFFWFRIFGSMLPSLLFLLLLWRFLKELIEEEGPRRMVLAAYGLGTMALTYGTLLIAHQLSALLMATGYILLHLHGRGKGSRWSIALAGLAAGGGVLVDYQVAFIGPPLFLYMLWVERGRGWRPLGLATLQFAAGAALPLVALLLYQWGCFDSPLRTGYHFPTTRLFQEWHAAGFLGLSKPSGVAFFGSFLRPDNGLFYFSPFLLLALPGLFLMLRRRQLGSSRPCGGRRSSRPCGPLRDEEAAARDEAAELGLHADAVLCTVLILFFAYFISSLTFWRSGWAVGPRYITCALPFYLVPVAVLVNAAAKRPWGRLVTYGLMAVSIIIYLTSNAVFPHYPENFSHPWFDVTLRFGRAGYLPYNLGWLLGLEGLPSAIPYLVVAGALLAALLLGGSGRIGRRAVLALGALALAFSILVFYHHLLRYRHLPVPVKFLPWMERMWEPRHEGMDLAKLLPAGDPRTGGLETKKPP